MSEHEHDVADAFLRRMAATLDDAEFARVFSPDGLAPTRDWFCEDGWIVSYTTKRIRAGKLDGLFAMFVYQPRGRGARSGKPERWERVKTDACDTRREAKQRALAVFYDHSPNARERHGWTGTGYADE